MRTLLLGALLLLAPILRGEEIIPLGEKEARELLATIPPSEEGAWARIPWRLDLAAAREEALRDDKPLFLWSLSGHPLGCS